MVAKYRFDKHVIHWRDIRIKVT